MRNTVVFEKVGLQLGTVDTRVNGSEFKTSDIRGYILRAERGRRETGLMVSTMVFAILALVFLIPIVEEILRPKFLFVVVVGIFLSAVSMQDFLNIRNPGETRLMLVTDYGARIGLQTASTTLLKEATTALNSLGIHQRHSIDSADFRMKTTGIETSSAS